MNLYVKNVTIILKNSYCLPDPPEISGVPGVVRHMCGNSFPAFHADQGGLASADSLAAALPPAVVPDALGERSKRPQVLGPNILLSLNFKPLCSLYPLRHIPRACSYMLHEPEKAQTYP